MMQPGVNGADRAAEDLGDFLARDFLEVMQYEDLPVFPGQPEKRRAQSFTLFRLDGPVRRAFAVERRQVALIGQACRNTPFPSQLSRALADRDAQYPGAQVRLSAKSRQPAPDPQKDLLSHVLRLVEGESEALRHANDLFKISPDDGLKAPARVEPEVSQERPVEVFDPVARIQTPIAPDLFRFQDIRPSETQFASKFSDSDFGPHGDRGAVEDAERRWKMAAPDDCIPSSDAGCQ